MLADQKGRFLYEIRPDVFPEGFLTTTEIQLQAMYLKYKSDLTGNALSG